MYSASANADGRQLSMSQTAAPKQERVAALVRDRIASGTLLPGESAPSSAELSRITGYAVITCRKALKALLAEGLLISGFTPGARLRVAGAMPEQTVTDTARALSAGLVTRRRAADLRQPDLAALIGCSLTAVGHAETGRLWHSRDWWELADKALSADGELLCLHDAYRAEKMIPVEPNSLTQVQRDPISAIEPDPDSPAESEIDPATVTITASDPLNSVKSIAITWSDGAVTIVRYSTNSSQVVALSLTGQDEVP